MKRFNFQTINHIHYNINSYSEQCSHRITHYNGVYYQGNLPKYPVFIPRLFPRIITKEFNFNLPVIQRQAIKILCTISKAKERVLVPSRRCQTDLFSREAEQGQSGLSWRNCFVSLCENRFQYESNYNIHQQFNCT